MIQKYNWIENDRMNVTGLGNEDLQGKPLYLCIWIISKLCVDW